MRWFFFVLLSLLFMVAPLQQGLYFDSDFYMVHIFIYSLTFLLMLRVLYDRDFTTWSDLLFILIIPICYLISLIQAKHPEGAFNMVFRWTTYISFFYLLYWSINKHPKIRQLAPYIYYATGVLITVHMLLNQFGLLNDPGAFIKDRFAGVFQYPNTFGMVMIAFYMFGLVMLLNKRQNWRGIFFYSFPLTAFIAAFLESYSRGMYLIFPIVWLIGICCFSFQHQLRYTLYTMITMLSGMLVFILLQKGNMFLTGISIVVLSLLSFLVIWWIYQLDLNVRLKKFHRGILPVIVIVFGILFGFDLANQGLIYKQLPANLQERMASIIDSSTARERVLIVEDAMEASLDAPLIGQGGKAWESIYRNYQQLPYQSKKIHNEYIEVILDIGYPGFLITISILAYLILRIWQTMRCADDRSIYLAILLSLATILAHSFIDFNLAFGFVVFMIFWLIAMGLKTIAEPKRLKKWPLYSLGIYAVILLFALTFAYRFMQADVSYQKAMNTDNLKEREQYLKEAISYNRFDTEYWYKLSDTLTNQKDQRKTKNAIYQMVALEPMNSQVIYQSGVLLEKINEKRDALHQYRNALELDPFDLRIYQGIIHLSVDLAGEHKSNRYAKIAIETYESMLNEYEQFEKNPIGQDHNRRGFEMTDAIEEDIVKAKTLLSHE
ncbi:O-antigen ligase family protein [Gracilibacillus suaedae]|uniref:O-antigen ligase family protein n=1 Tax=Gracilibacillus suaedae TaxID=2820273 RepID=UPI001ABEDC93|nr:O-antigen ligase family protein [Gracilibacillus suaedae]